MFQSLSKSFKGKSSAAFFKAPDQATRGGRECLAGAFDVQKAFLIIFLVLEKRMKVKSLVKAMQVQNLSQARKRKKTRVLPNICGKSGELMCLCKL